MKNNIIETTEKDEVVIDNVFNEIERVLKSNG